MRSLCAFFLASSVLLAQTAVNPGVNPVKLASPPTDTWPTYNGDYSGRRFSPLTKINSSNISSLSLAFVYRANGMPGVMVQVKPSTQPTTGAATAPAAK